LAHSQRQSSTHRCRRPRGRSSTRAPDLEAAWSSRWVGKRVPRHAADRRGKGEELAMLHQLLLGERQGQLQQGVQVLLRLL
jgi:hypothetical protein